MASDAGTTTPRKGSKRRVLTLAACAVALLLMSWIARTVWWYGWGYNAHIEERKHWVLHEVDHAQLLAECRALLAANTTAPADTTLDQTGLSPLLQRYGPRWIELIPLHVDGKPTEHVGLYIPFERQFALVAVPEGGPENPDMPAGNTPTELIPGLWYLEYGGH